MTTKAALKPYVIKITSGFIMHSLPCSRHYCVLCLSVGGHIAHISTIITFKNLTFIHIMYHRPSDSRRWRSFSACRKKRYIAHIAALVAQVWRFSEAVPAAATDDVVSSVRESVCYFVVKCDKSFQLCTF
jgi:hypothetical protein